MSSPSVQAQRVWFPALTTTDAHRIKRRLANEAGAIHVECPAGSVAFWDGSIWHTGNAPRRMDGRRVVVHISYSRLALRPVESYDFLDEEWLKDKPYEMRGSAGTRGFPQCA